MNINKTSRECTTEENVSSKKVSGIRNTDVTQNYTSSMVETANRILEYKPNTTHGVIND